MTKCKIFTILFLFLICLVKPIQIFSQGRANIRTLSGFDSLFLLSFQLAPELEEEGVTKKQLDNDIKIKLSKAGIKTTDKFGEGKDNLIQLQVFVFVYPDWNQNNSFSGDIKTSLNQRVILDRNQSISLIAPTWDMSTRVFRQSAMSVRDIVLDQIDNFINDYLKANASTAGEKVSPQPTYIPKKKQDNSPFKAVYVGGNVAPTIEVFNDTDRTMYFDFGQGKMTAYTIPSGKSQKITVPEGIYNFKASAPRVRSDEGQETFNKGYAYDLRP